MALGGASMAVFEWSAPDIAKPGALALALLAAALLAAGPPRVVGRDRRAATGVALAIGAALFAASGALGWANEKDAALLSFPLWAFPVGLGMLGATFARSGRAFALSALVAIGVCRLAGQYFQGATSELFWWIASFAWIGAVVFLSAAIRRSAGDSVPLVAGVLWFVLLLAVLTIQEVRNPMARLGSIDDAGAVDAVCARPFAGFGTGSFPNVMLEFSRRGLETAVDDGTGNLVPRMAAPTFATRAILRLAVDAGLPALLAGFAGLVFATGASLARGNWTRERIAALGVAGLWLGALCSMRDAWVVPLSMLCLAAPAAFGRDPSGEGEHADRRRYAFESWGIALAFALVAATFMPVARWRWSRENPVANPKVEFSPSHWARPWSDKAWAIRARSAEIAKYADPRDWLEPVAEQWLRASPRSEFAWVERIRVAEKKGGPAAAEKTALAAHERLPGSATIMLWVARARAEQGRTLDAAEFLERAAADRPPAHPLVRARIVELRTQLARERRQ